MYTCEDGTSISSIHMKSRSVIGEFSEISGSSGRKVPAKKCRAMICHESMMVRITRVVSPTFSSHGAEALTPKSNLWKPDAVVGLENPVSLGTCCRRRGIGPINGGGAVGIL